MTFSPASLLSIAPQLVAYLKDGVDHYVMLRAAGKEASAQLITMHLEAQMTNWDPRIGGVALLDPETRQAAARFLAGVATNIASA
jgi:hypothetical protein